MYLGVHPKVRTAASWLNSDGGFPDEARCDETSGSCFRVLRTGGHRLGARPGLAGASREAQTNPDADGDGHANPDPDRRVYSRPSGNVGHLVGHGLHAGRPDRSYRDAAQ
jgi:hypothetical protein